jgi:hypothetical protein
MNKESLENYEILDIIHSMYSENILQNLCEYNMPSLYRYTITWQLTCQHLAHMCVSIIGNKFNQNLVFSYTKITDGRSSHLGLCRHTTQLQKKAVWTGIPRSQFPLYSQAIFKTNAWRKKWRQNWNVKSKMAREEGLWWCILILRLSRNMPEGYEKNHCKKFSRATCVLNTQFRLVQNRCKDSCAD